MQTGELISQQSQETERQDTRADGNRELAGSWGETSDLVLFRFEVPEAREPVGVTVSWA